MDLGELPADRLYVVSDTHFQHKNVIEYCKRPFSDTDHMDAAMRDLWIANVPQDAIVLHLGDVAMGRIDDRILDKLGPLTGARKILVAGNHDRTLIKRGYAAKLFHEVYDLVRFTVRGKSVIATHYPFESWREDIALHGHAHGQSRKIPARLDVGIDCFGAYYPLPWERILTELNRA